MHRLMPLAAALGTLSWAAPAAAAPLYVCDYNAEVARSTIVVQLSEQQVTRTGLGQCAMTGRVVRSFRGDLALGTTVQTSFACADDAVEPSVNGYEWDPAMVAGARAVELHSLGGGTGPSGYGAGLVLLDAPTDTIARDGFCR